jgi:D-alanine-D-alanine ligase
MPETAEPTAEPPGQPRWKIAVLANIKEKDKPLPADVPPDAGADYDYIETINLIRAALETGGHETVFIPADANLPWALREARPDICFNIAEGLGGDAREAQVPAVLELLKIPYTGSRVMANAISLDKTLTKRIWRDRRLPVAPFQEYIVGDESLRPELRFPLFVKPAREGTGMGVDMNAIVENEIELHERVDYIIGTYRQPALVETFLSGREFTVGMIGRWDSKRYSRHPEWYDEKNGYHVFPVLELDSSRSVTPLVYSQAAKSAAVGDEDAPGYICPADIEPELARKLQALTIKAHQAIKAIDVSRSDIRLNAEGQPYLLEINTLPGLTPGYSDLCLEAGAEGISYEDLVLDILQLGASRWGLVAPRQA